MKNLFVFLLLLSSLQAWGKTGHFIVSRIAELELENKKYFPKILDIIVKMNPFTKADKKSFVECSTFADDIKAIDFDFFNKWHYYSQPYIPSSISSSKKNSIRPSELDVPQQNMVWAINQAKKTIRNTRNSGIDDYFTKSFAFRFLIHLVGDIHQPLHNISRIQDSNLKADAGGNAVNLTLKQYKGNLHSWWDKTLGQYSQSINVPFNENHWKKLNEYVSDLLVEFPKKNFKEELKEESIRKWQQEGYKLAKQYAYDDKKLYKDTDKYIDQGRKIVRQQLALAGYRLAQLIDELVTADDQILEKHHNKLNISVESDVSMESVSEEGKKKIVIKSTESIVIDALKNTNNSDGKKKKREPSKKKDSSKKKKYSIDDDYEPEKLSDESEEEIFWLKYGKKPNTEQTSENNSWKYIKIVLIVFVCILALLTIYYFFFR